MVKFYFKLIDIMGAFIYGVNGYLGVLENLMGWGVGVIAR